MMTAAAAQFTPTSKPWMQGLRRLGLALSTDRAFDGDSFIFFNVPAGKILAANVVPQRALCLMTLVRFRALERRCCLMHHVVETFSWEVGTDVSFGGPNTIPWGAEVLLVISNDFQPFLIR